MQVAFYLAGEITQVIDSIPWVRCASGNVYLIHVEQVQEVDGVEDDVLVAKHLRCVQHHQGHRVINDGYHENYKDDQGDGEDAVEHHVFFVMFANNALALHVLSPPDPLLVQVRSHLHLLRKPKK